MSHHTTLLTVPAQFPSAPRLRQAGAHFITNPSSATVALPRRKANAAFAQYLLSNRQHSCACAANQEREVSPETPTCSHTQAQGTHVAPYNVAGSNCLVPTSTQTAQSRRPLHRKAKQCNRHAAKQGKRSVCTRYPLSARQCLCVRVANQEQRYDQQYPPEHKVQAAGTHFARDI